MMARYTHFSAAVSVGRGLTGATTLWGHTRWTGHATTPLRFPGQQHDPETGLHYNRHRYYNPTTSTYTTPDPLGIGPNPTSSTAYVHNPHTWTHPLGLHPAGNPKGDTPGPGSGADNVANGPRLSEQLRHEEAILDRFAPVDP